MGWRLRLALAVAAGLSPALAGEPFYLGTWRIASAAVAPWADAKQTPDPAEMKSLVGKTVVFQAREISGPRQVACKAPHYKVVEVPAEGLFQGAFDEMHRRDAAVDPRKLAEKVGFRGASWKSLETGCGNELDYHFTDSATAAFGLNDYVYTLKKQ